MKIIENEQEIKRESFFLKIEDGCIVKIKSHLIVIETAFDQKSKKRILWSKKLGLPKRKELFYFVELNGVEGVLRLPISVFFAMNEIERLTGNDKRRLVWILGKKGEGLKTKYAVAVKETIPIQNEEEIEKNTEKLKKILISYEKKLAENLREFLSEKSQEGKNEENPEDIPLDDLEVEEG